MDPLFSKSETRTRFTDLDDAAEVGDEEQRGGAGGPAPLGHGRRRRLLSSLIQNAARVRGITPSPVLGSRRAQIQPPRLDPAAGATRVVMPTPPALGIRVAVKPRELE